MNLKTGDQTELGGVRVATDVKPEDGTTWVPYGTNQAGQPVWAQNLPTGDADLQRYIIDNASGLVGAGKLAYIPTTGAYTQYAAGISGTVMLPFIGGGGGLTLGVQSDGTLGGTSPYIQVQANGMASAGAYAGVGGGVGISHSNGPITSGSGSGAYAEADAGFGPSGGVNFAINDNGTIGGIGGAAPTSVFPGVGYGAGIGAGRSWSSTLVLPTVNDFIGRKK